MSGSVLRSACAVASVFVLLGGGAFTVACSTRDGEEPREQTSPLVQSPPDAVGAIDAVRAARDGVAVLPPEAFENAHVQKALVNKLDATLKAIAAGDLDQALAKLEDDVLAKTDGCAAQAAPDANDWIRACSDQSGIHSLVEHAIALLKATPLRLAFVVNEDHYTIAASDLSFTAATASASLGVASGRTYLYQGATWGRHGASTPQEIFREYVLSHPQDPADYVVVFSKDEMAVTYGGYQLTPFGAAPADLAWLRASAPSYCNPAGSPYLPPGVVYGAVMDWGHLLGGCGYELQGLERVHVSDVSFDGQCRNTPGLSCVLQYGEWQCPNLLADPSVVPQLADRRLWIADMINHELLHNFGTRGNFDHVCPPTTPESVAAQSAFNICGTTVVALRDAGTSCVADAQ